MPSIGHLLSRCFPYKAVPLGFSIAWVKPHRVILLHPLAPAKPAVGQACNGCGVCCAAEPCPVGMVLSRRSHGRCVALSWHPAQNTYRCGAATHPLPALPRWAAAAWQKLALRWISAGSGCDCSLQAEVG